MPPRFVTERFHVLRPLGSGGFGDVYEAQDRINGSVIALKVLRHVEPRSLLRFKHEFRRASRLVHRNLIRLYELIEEAEHWFFTMELVRGTHLLEYLDAQRPHAHEAACRRSFSQLSHAVEALHGVGIVHRDIKPSNVMVGDDGRVVLLDFGIAKEIVPGQADVTSMLFGTPHYLAPERLHGMPAREPSDWYSVGVMLFQALTGRFPYDGDWLTAAVDTGGLRPGLESPRSIRGDVPADLNDLCVALLSRQPEKRPTAAETRALLNAGDAAVEDAPAALQALPSDAARFVGRASELEELRRAVTTRQGPVAIHVSGPSGIGKTALVWQFVAGMRREDPSAVILSGACHQQESVPFNALDEFVDHLTDYLAHLPSGPPLILPSQSALIGRVFPVFTRVNALAVSFAKSGPPDPVEMRRQAFAALRLLLARLSARSPLVIAIDDVQWADRDSAIFLEELFASADAPSLTLILSYRDQADERNETIARLREAHEASARVHVVHVPVRELPAADARQLIRRLAGDAPNVDGRTIERIAADADGNPFLIHRLAHRILAAPERIADIDNRTLILEEMSRLMPVQRALIETVAVARQPVPTEVAVHAAASPHTVPIDLGGLLTLRLLQLHRRGGEELVDIYHDRIRKPLLDSLSADTRAARHQALIDALERLRPHESERLAYHCELTGQTGEASSHALAAAHQASQALAFDKAVTLYTRALALGSWEPQERHRIQVDVARALANAGRGGEAAPAYLTAAASTDGISRIRLRIKAADQYLRTGYIAEGEALLRQLLNEVGLRWVDRPVVIIGSMLFHRWRARLLMRSLESRVARHDDETELARMEVLWAAAVGLSMSDPIRSAQFSAWHLSLALRNGNAYRIALALAGEATQCAHADGGRDGRPQELLQAAMRYARRSGTAHATAFVHSMTGVTAFLGGRWTDATTASERALNQFRDHCVGVSWETATAASFLCTAQVFLGRLTDQARLLPPLVAEARTRGDLYAADMLPALTLSWVQHLVADHPAAALAELRDWPSPRSSSRWRVQDTNALAARADIAAYGGDARAAWTLMRDNWPLVRRSLMVRVITIKVLLLFTRARCALALAITPDVSARERASLMRVADSCCRSLVRTRCGWAMALAMAIRAGMASCAGEASDAQRLLEQAAADLQAVELLPWFHSARWHLAAEREHATGVAEPVDEWWIAERIVDPNRIAQLLVPGRWPGRTTHLRRESA